MLKVTQLSVILGAVLALGTAHGQDRPTQEDSRTNATSAQSDQTGRDQRKQSQGTTRQPGDDAKRTAAKDQQGTKQSQSGAVVLPVVTVLVPVAMEKKADTSLANGCWAKLYGQKNLGGDSLTLVGPVDMPDMTGPFGIEWDDKVTSIQAGPRATVTIYDNENYRDRAATVKAGQQVNELSDKLGLFEEVKSMRINCSGAG